MSIKFGAMPQRNGTWAWLKPMIATKSLMLQYEEDAETYTVYGYDLPEVLFCVIYKGEVPSSVAASYPQATNDADREDFETHYKAKANIANDRRSPDGRLRVASAKSDDPKITIITHDWTDPTTWYSGSVRVVDEVATNSGNQLTYELTNPNVIDTYHGLITGEDYLRDDDDNSYRVVVKVNDVVKTEQDPHDGAGGDFTINYALGEITFLAALDPADVVKVTYHCATTSLFVVAPPPGRSLQFTIVEVQFSEDVIITDTVIFQPYGLVDVFAPQLLIANGGPLASGTKIPIDDASKFKTISDYQNDAVRAYPLYPAMGGNSWRGASQKIIVFDWDYASQAALLSAAGMEIRIFLEHEVPLGGWYCTATFYCTHTPET